MRTLPSKFGSKTPESIEELVKLDPIEPVHHFGVRGEGNKTLYFARIPLVLSGNYITVRADVIDGNDPFLIELSNLKNMKARHNLFRKVLRLKIGNKSIDVVLQEHEKHQIVHLFTAVSTFNTTRTETEPKENIDLRKLHVNIYTGHAALNDMQTLLNHPGKRDPILSEQLQSII